MRILITGATGNVGIEVLHALNSQQHPHSVVAGVRNVEKARRELSVFREVDIAAFDFDQINQFGSYLNAVDVLFLLRPPHIADVPKYFKPLIDAAVQQKVKHIVFLSVQGADKSTLIPHHKIEKLIEASGIAYTFLRPAYFMQNFSTSLRRDIVEKDQVYLPSGKAKFTLIDLKDVGEVAAKVLIGPSKYRNMAMDLTNDEQLNFAHMCATLSQSLGREIEHKSPYLLSFFLRKRKEKVPTGFIMVMIMLHYLPRFQSTPPTSDWVERILGRKPGSFKEFVKRDKDVWL